jgi:hypothetical protein
LLTAAISLLKYQMSLFWGDFSLKNLVNCIAHFLKECSMDHQCPKALGGLVKDTIPQALLQTTQGRALEPVFERTARITLTYAQNWESITCDRQTPVIQSDGHHSGPSSTACTFNCLHCYFECKMVQPL